MEDNNLILFNIFIYSLSHLNNFRSQVKSLSELLTSDRSLKSIFSEIEKFAFKSGNEYLKAMPIEILVKNVSAKNKYIDELKTFKTKISGGDDYNALIKDCLDRYRVNRIKNEIENLALKVYEGNYERSREILSDINLMIATDVVEPNPEKQNKELKQYAKNLKAYRLSTGYKIIDEITDGGICQSQLWGFSGRTGKGKTWFACNLVWKIIEANEGSVQPVFLTNEMRYTELAVRLLALKRKKLERTVEEEISMGMINSDIEELNSIIKIYEKCYELERIESIVKMESNNNGNWLFFLDHFHNLSSAKKTEGESQAYLAHELQAMSQKYNVTFIIMYQNSKIDYNEADTTFKGRGDTIEVTNYGFNILQDKELMMQKGYDPDGSQIILKFTPIKIRRGIYKTFYLLQDFRNGGQILEYQI